MLQYKRKYLNNGWVKEEIKDLEWIEQNDPRSCTPIYEFWGNSPRDKYDRELDDLAETAINERHIEYADKLKNIDDYYL